MQKFISEHLILASGCMKSCIYDLDNKVIYRISNKLKDDIFDFFVHKNQSEKYLKDIGILHANKYLHEYQPIFKDNITFSWVEITSNCNFFCKHCYNGERHNKELSYDEVNKIFIKLKKMGINNIQITGGEPLLHTSFNNIIELSTTHFKSVEVFTNAYLLDDTKLALIKNSNIKLAISIHSLIRDENDFITGIEGSFDKVLSNINKIKNYDINYRLVSVKTKWTPNDVHVNDVKIKNDPVRIVGRANLTLIDRSILRKKIITEEYFTKKLNPKFVLRNFFRHNCFGSKLYVSCTGDCYPCVMERRIKLGNITKDDIEYDIFNIGKQYSKANIEDCSHCEYRLACYDCRPDALTDNLLAKPWFCTYSPKEARWNDPDQFMDSILLN